MQCHSDLLEARENWEEKVDPGKKKKSQVLGAPVVKIAPCRLQGGLKKNI